MKQICILIAGLAISAGCLAAPKVSPTQLVCPMKDHNGQSAMTMELSLNEADSTIKWEKIIVPATYSNAEVNWVMGQSGELPSGYMHRLDRYSGQLTVSVVGQKSKQYLTLFSGIYAAASKSDRKF